MIACAALAARRARSPRWWSVMHRGFCCHSRNVTVVTKSFVELVFVVLLCRSACRPMSAAVAAAQGVVGADAARAVAAAPVFACAATSAARARSPQAVACDAPRVRQIQTLRMIS